MANQTQPIDFERFNPFRRPDWRYERVLTMVDRYPHPGRSSPRRDDTYVKGLRNFILRYRHGDDVTRNALGFENAGLYWAYQINDRRNEDHETAMIVEARLLADQPDEEIAKEVGTIPESIHWYEALFYNVRDRLKSHDWILKHALIPAIQTSRQRAVTTAAVERERTGNSQFVKSTVSEPFFDATVKFFAYFGGKLLLEYVLSGFRRGVIAHTREEIGAWFDQHWTHRIKHRSSAAATTFELNRFQVMQLFEVHARIIEIERSADSEEQAQSLHQKEIQALLSEMPWAVGDFGKQSVQGTLIEAYDAGAVEPRDNELMLLGAGRHPSTIDQETKQFRLPLPRQQLPGGDARQEAKDGSPDAQQGS